jgi:hypothetical protein
VAWEQLTGVYELAAQFARDERDVPPEACPEDGTPLEQASEGVLVCPFDGWQWPRDKHF